MAVVLGMWLDWRHADAGVGIGMPALVKGLLRDSWTQKEVIQDTKFENWS